MCWIILVRISRILILLTLTVVYPIDNWSQVNYAELIILLDYLSQFYWNAGLRDFLASSHHLSHSSNPFCSGYFGRKVLLFSRAAWTFIFQIYTSCIWDERHVLTCTIFFCLERVSRTFLSGTMVLQISDSKEARIMGLNQGT
jgi:hypothetical protein